ncbi:MAG TPA: hypothetical protein ENK00_04435 [Chromatiales bacterium]|nr:hypothetical protein [Chromatiales bacterium]
MMRRWICLSIVAACLLPFAAHAGKADRELLEEEGYVDGYWPKSGILRIDGVNYQVPAGLVRDLKGIPAGAKVYYGVRNGQLLGVIVRDRSPGVRKRQVGR